MSMSVDVSEYDIDPTEFDYGVRCKTHDRINNRTNHLGNLKHSDIWVAYQTWQSGPDEISFAIKGIGRPSRAGVQLDKEVIAETIRERATRVIRDDRDEWVETDAKLLALVEAADEVAENLEEYWQRGSTEAVYQAIYDRVADIDGTIAWTSYVEAAFHYEVEEALRDAGVEADEHDCVHDTTLRGISEAVKKRRDRHFRPDLQYEIKLKFDIEPWELRAFEHLQWGTLTNKPELAETKALLESGHDYREIAEILDKSPSIVSRQKQQIEDWESRSKWTVDQLD